MTLIQWLLLAPVVVGFFWCCCGERDCTVFADDFNRADSTTIGASWTETAGNWTITSNKLQITTANAVLTYSTAFGCSGSHRITATVRSTASGDTVRVGQAELVIGTGKLRLYETIGGTPTVIRECSVTASTNTDYRLAVLNGTYTTTVYLDGVAVLASAGQIAAARTLGTGGTVTGTVTFDDFSIENAQACDAVVYAGCPESLQGCWPVVSGANPAQVSVVVSGASTIFGGCSGGECSSLDGTYVLDNAGLNTDTGIGYHLLYELTGLSIACGGTTVTRARLYINRAWTLAEFIGDCCVCFTLDDPTNLNLPRISMFGAIGATGVGDSGHHTGSPGPTAGCGSAALTLSTNTDVITGGPYQRAGCSATSAVCTPV